MSEPELIRSGAPHSVAVSQGSKVAGGNKSAEHSIRQTLAGEDPMPIQREEAPELKLSPRITTAAEPVVPDLPPPVQPLAEGEGPSLALPPAFPSADEPESTVLQDLRVFKDDVVSLQGEIPAQPQLGEQLMADLPEALAQPSPQQKVEAAPTLERFESDPRVAVPESLATAEAPQAQTPILERVEQAHPASFPEALPSAEGLAPEHAPVLMRSEQDQVAVLPESSARAVEQNEPDAPVLERIQSDTLAAVPESLPALAQGETDGPIVSRASSDTVVELPPELPAVEAAAQEFPISRHEDEHLATVPSAEAVAFDPATGPVISRAENDTLVAVPEAQARLVSEPEMPPPAAGRAEFGLAEAEPREPEEIIEIFELPEADKAVPASEPQPSAALAAPEAQPSEQQMAQMNFPARVIKLKIANDKVRVQLDALEAPERPRR